MDVQPKVVFGKEINAMTQATIRSSRPDKWVSPRPPMDPTMRAIAYGKVRPMAEPNWLERLLGKN